MFQTLAAKFGAGYAPVQTHTPAVTPAVTPGPAGYLQDLATPTGPAQGLAQVASQRTATPSPPVHWPDEPADETPDFRRTSRSVTPPAFGQAPADPKASPAWIADDELDASDFGGLVLHLDPEHGESPLVAPEWAGQEDPPAAQTEAPQRACMRDGWDPEPTLVRAAFIPPAAGVVAGTIACLAGAVDPGLGLCGGGFSLGAGMLLGQAARDTASHFCGICTPAQAGDRVQPQPATPYDPPPHPLLTAGFAFCASSPGLCAFGLLGHATGSAWCYLLNIPLTGGCVLASCGLAREHDDWRLCPFNCA